MSGIHVVVHGRLLALALAAALTAIFFPTPSQARIPDGAFRVVSSNIASGAECRGFDCFAAVHRNTGRFSPDVVAAQEACRVDVLTFAAKHPLLDVRYSGKTQEHQGCTTGGKGLMLAADRLTNVQAHALGGDKATARHGTKRFTMLCGDVRRVRACTVHLPHGVTRKVRGRQLAVVRDVLRSHPRVMLSGDLNARPGSWVLRRLRRDGFRLADQRDLEWTHRSGAKIDYILFKGGSKRRAGDARGQSTSDHRLMRGWRR